MQPDFELRFHPLDLSRFGKTPKGKPMYRIVWADTRKSTCFYMGKRYTLPRYQHGDEASASGKWVMEKWVPAEKLLGMTAEQYGQMQSAMPHMAYEKYPVDGDYELSYVFHSGHVDEQRIVALLAAHEQRFANTTATERTQQVKDREEQKEVATGQKFDALYDEAREESFTQ
jgi:hypothetical protein